MQIRIEGTIQEISVVIDKIKSVLPVKSVSRFYSNRNNYNGRVYIALDEKKL